MVALARTREAAGEAKERDGRDARAGAKLLGRAVRPRALRFGEALALSARALAELPLPPTLVLCAAGLDRPVRVVLATAAGPSAAGPSAAGPSAAGLSAAGPSAAGRTRGEPGEVVLDVAEWRAIGLGAESDRLWPADLVALLRRKASDPAFRITDEVALAGAQPDPAEEWSAARVLERIGAEAVAVELP